MKEKSASIVSLEGIPVMVMEQLLSYLYTGEIKVSEANAEDLIASANYLLLPRLKNIACKFIERHMSASNCIFSYLFEETYFRGCPVSMLKDLLHSLNKVTFP